MMDVEQSSTLAEGGVRGPGSRWPAAVLGAVVGAVVMLLVALGWQAGHQPEPAPVSYGGFGVVTKTPAANQGVLCIKPDRGSVPPPGPAGPCGMAYTDTSGPDLADLRHGDRIHFQSFETMSPDEGTISGWIITRPRDQQQS